MTRRALLTIAIFGVISIGLVLALGGYRVPGLAGKKVIVLGFDGIDPRVVKNLAESGQLPNFRKLMEEGSFAHLATTLPPQSPVAWATFMTGLNPGGHNIYDFLARDPKTYMPKLTITEIAGGHELHLGEYVIPVEKPDVMSQRHGEPFWEIAEKNGIHATVLQVPVTFPPDEHAKMLSGMGVPDILGTNGTFTYFTTDPAENRAQTGGQVTIVARNGDRIETSILGPKNEFLQSKPSVTIPLEITFHGSDAVGLRAGNQTRHLTTGGWSDWVPLEFPMSFGVAVKGIARFYLIEAEPVLKLYMSPVNIDPLEPVMPISNPADYSAVLAKKFGYFYTQGMPEDTWALNEKRIDDAAFMKMTHDIQDERVRIFKDELRNLDSGLLVAVFVAPDRIQHMFHRYIDPQNPLYPKDAGEIDGKAAILEAYQICDRILEFTMSYVDSETTLMVVSDHGFSSFRRAVHLNSWLMAKGFMVPKNPAKRESGELFENVDLARSDAYALGLNSIFLNLKGREGKGKVDPANAKRIKAAIIKELEELTDPLTGLKIVSKVYDSAENYSGAWMADAPDLVVGYYDGYRTSWQTALGGAPADIFEDNMKKWSGDHLIDPVLVPGTFVSNRKLGKSEPGLIDMAATVLAEFGIKKPAGIGGEPVLEK